MEIANIAEFILYTIYIAIVAIGINIVNRKKENKEKEKNKKDVDNSLIPYIFSSPNSDKGEGGAEIAIYSSVLAMIDNFIYEAITTYSELQAHSKDHYIDAKETAAINRYVLVSLGKNMTPAVKRIISLVYNFRDDEDLKEFLELRIKLIVVKLVVANNKPIE